ncbi:Uncharacterised protein [Halioglobus japonicus]|nr:Uncharacterised protein [Halioglobus japonicus]
MTASDSVLTRRPRLGSKAYVLLMAVLGSLLVGCTVVGPAAISSGRLAYNEAITATDNQQMLMVLIQNRYGERGNLLTVASVTANVSVTTSGGIQAGFGSTSDYRGNLVPFSGSVVYEENPTISYVPVSGERYLRQLTSPISLLLLTQLSRAMTNPAPALSAFITSVNYIYNPNFIFGEDQEDPRFDKFIHIIATLTREHRLHWVQSDDDKTKFSIVIDQSESRHAAQVKQLLQLLGLPAARPGQRQVVIPVFMALDGAASGGLGLTTRSVWDLVEILSASIEVPASDEAAGVVVPSPIPGRVGRQLKIAFSTEEPEHAYIAVADRDGWFYIDERDLVTKEYFRLLSSLWTMTMSKAIGQGAVAPLLTVPVSN